MVWFSEWLFRYAKLTGLYNWGSVCSPHSRNWIFKYVAGPLDKPRGALTTAMTTYQDLDNGLKQNCTVITPSTCLDGVDNEMFTCYFHIENQRKVRTAWGVRTSEQVDERESHRGSEGYFSSGVGKHRFEVWRMIETTNIKFGLFPPLHKIIGPFTNPWSHI